MKKTLSILLAVLLIASMSVTAFAEEGKTETYDEIGITLTLPEDFDGLKGSLYASPYGAVLRDPDLFYMQIYYFAVPDDLFAKALNQDEKLTEEETATMRAGQGVLADVYATQNPEIFLEDADEGTSLEDLGLVQFGTADGFGFYYWPAEDEEYLERIGEDYAEEFTALQDSFLKVLQDAELYAPVDPAAAMVGKTFSFETVDLEGNKVTSEELFADNEITMINFWGTWCGPCRGELAELSDIHERLAEKGCGIVGIVDDALADDQDSLDKAKGLLMENGVGYPNIVPNEDMADILDNVSAFPTSFFVDKSGTILCIPIEGAAVDEYEDTIDSLLKGSEKITRSPKPQAQDNGLECYRVLVYDVDGNPVKGVSIQFCSDSMCNMNKTDADGIARFDMDEGMEYTVHVLKVPAGYAKESGEYVTQTVYSDVTIFLDKEA